MARILRSINGECCERLSDNDQGNQNLPEVRRQDLFRRAGRALPQMRAEECARQFRGCICSRGDSSAEASAKADDPGRSDTPSATDENGAPNNKKPRAPLSCSES